MPAARLVIVRCTRCAGPTAHDVLGVTELRSYIDGPDVHVVDEFRLIKCRGCGRPSFWYRGSNSEDYDPTTDTPTYTDRFFSGVYGVRFPISEVSRLPRAVKAVYLEALDSINRESPISSAIVIRSIIEAICADKGLGNIRGLENKINGLANEKFLLPTQAEILHLHRELGNSATHELRNPEIYDLISAFDIVESILQIIYILPYQSWHLRESIKWKLETTLQALDMKHEGISVLLLALADDAVSRQPRDVVHWSNVTGIPESQINVWLDAILLRYEANESELRMVVVSPSSSEIKCRMPEYIAPMVGDWYRQTWST